MFLLFSVGRLLNMWWYVFGVCKYTKSRLMKISCPFQSKLPTLLCKAWCCNSYWFPCGAKKLTSFSYIKQMTEKNIENISVVTSPLGTKTCLFVLTFLLCSEELSPHLKYDVKSPDLLYRFTFQYVPTLESRIDVG